MHDGLIVVNFMHDSVHYFLILMYWWRSLVHILSVMIRGMMHRLIIVCSGMWIVMRIVVRSVVRIMMNLRIMWIMVWRLTLYW